MSRAPRNPPASVTALPVVSCAHHISAGDRAIITAEMRHRRPNTRPVVSGPNAKRSGKVFGSRDGFGAESRELMSVGKFGHSVSKVANRNHLDVGVKVEELSSQRLTGTAGPRTGEGPSGCGHGTSTQSNQIEIGCGRFMIDEHLGQPVAQLTGKQVAQEMVVEDRSAHVVARSGSSAKP